MTVRRIQYGSAEYDATVELRREILRRPLGLDFTPQQLAAEVTDTHLGLFDGDQILACLILTPKHHAVLRMRQVAVRADRQGQGLGRRLVEASEAMARERGFIRMTLHARETALAFYLSLGYGVEGVPFEEVGIPHRTMLKKL